MFNILPSELRPVVDRNGYVMAVISSGPKGNTAWWADINDRATRDIARLYDRGDVGQQEDGESRVVFGTGYGLLHPVSASGSATIWR